MRERQKMEFLKKEADYIIDTSRLLTRELKTELEKIFVQDEEFNSMYVTILSFGFKYGIPADSDIVMDVRFLPNPYYVEELRPKTGNDVEIQQYVMKYDEAKIFFKQAGRYGDISDSTLYFRGQESAGNFHRMHRRETSFRHTCQ